MKQEVSMTNNEIADIYQRHVKTVYGVCFAYMKNPDDTEDAVSETFVKMIKSAPTFESVEHEKAWLIRTATNVCKDFLKHWWQKRKNLDDYSNSLQTDGELEAEVDGVMEAILNLPENYKTVIYLYYYEGYSSEEIAKMLKKPRSTVLNLLSEARKILKEVLGDEK